MAISAIQVFAIGVGTLALWRILRRFLVKDPLAVIPGPTAGTWLFGNMGYFFNSEPASWKYRDQITKQYGSFYTIKGFLQESHVVVSDPKALYHILIKDQDIYEEGGDTIRVNSVVFGPGLLSTLGEQHRKQRKILTPVFSAAHMRDMTPVFHSVVNKLDNTLAQLVTRGEQEIDILSWMTRTALELVAQSGLGYSFDTLEPDSEEHIFGKYIRDLVGTVNDPAIFFLRMSIYPYISKIGSSAFQRRVVDAIPWKKLHYLRDMVDVMQATSVDIFEKAKQRLDNDDGTASSKRKSKDIMTALVKANRLASDEDRLTDDELIGQVSTLTFAAMDTTSNAMSRILWLLSQHPEAQDKLRQEVTEAYASHDGDLDYDALNSCAFLDAVCRETLRLHPSAPYIARQCRKDSILPLGTPITTRDGREINEVLVPNDTLILISILGCNRDPAIWGPDAEEWKPERWLSPLPASVTGARVPGVYSNLMTFLGGGRSCIGFKFSQLEMKVVISHLVMKFKFEPSGKKIVWLYNGIAQPSVEGEGIGPGGNPGLQMPLKVSLVNA